jgi:hypothetical protein
MFIGSDVRLDEWKWKEGIKGPAALCSRTEAAFSSPLKTNGLLAILV